MLKGAEGKNGGLLLLRVEPTIHIHTYQRPELAVKG
jgi:hypothetical protein